MSTFLDRAKVQVRAGKGGDGMVAFRREKYVPRGGPAGGNGGRGGDVIFKVDEGLHTLLDFRYNRHFRAANGENGMSKGKYGRGADDLVVKVPPGTIIRLEESGEILADLTDHNQEVVIAKGGRGGRGNIQFASARNPAPNIAENGEPGEEFEIELELKLIADVGLVGFPSVGKSTLLSVISNAKPKIADYQFTTLEPNLGVVRLDYGAEFVVADMPGLIEGASKGVGLGMNFLRHIERTKVLIHVIDMAAVHGRDPFEDFMSIQEELGAYHERLLERPMVIAANKMDQPVAQENLKEFKQALDQSEYGEKNFPIFEISAASSQGLEELLNETYQLLQATDFISLVDEEIAEQVHYRLEEETPDFVIHNLGDGQFEITGDAIERLYQMTNMQYEESIQRFTRQMKAMGIDEALRDKGAQDGDLVHLLDFQFEFME